MYMGLFTKAKTSDGWLAISLQDGGVSAARIARKPSAKPVVEKVMFYAGDSAAQSATLEKLAKDANAERYQCSVLLASNEYQLLSVEAPNVPPEELKTAIRWRLKDMLDFHVDDATIDVLDVPANQNAAVRSHAMYAVAARNKLIEHRQKLFENTGIPLRVIDIPEMAQRNIAALLEQEGRGLALLSFDADGGMLTVSFAGELYLSRRLDVPLSQLTQTDAEQRTACHDRITLELQRSLDHFDRQYHFITLSKLILAPMGEAASALQAYLAANLYVPVEVLDLTTVFDFSDVRDLNAPAAQQRYFMTLGAALRHEEKVL